MATQTGFVCKQCLSRNKFCQDLLRHRCKDTQKHNFKLTTSKVFVRWNGTYLEPAIRTLPQDTPLPPGHSIVICQGGPHCRLEQCIFAHDTKELKSLNEQLKQTRRDNSKGMDASQRVPVTPTVPTVRPVYPVYPRPVHPVHFAGHVPLLPNPGGGRFRCPFPPSPGAHLNQPTYTNGFWPQATPGIPAHGLSCRPNIPPPPRNAAKAIQLQVEDLEYAASKEEFAERIKEQLDIEDIQQALSQENYKRKFHNLVCWEEKTHIEILQKKCDGRYCLEIYGRGCEPDWIHPYGKENCRDSYYGVVSGINPDKIAYATQASEAAFIVDKKEETEGLFEVRCEILPANYNHTDDKLYVVFSSTNFVKLKKMLRIDFGVKQTVEVEFEVAHLFFNTLIKAISSLKNDIISRIVPNKENFIPPRRALLSVDEIIDTLVRDGDEHKKVLRNLEYCHPESPPVLVSGPFGTGKTRLLTLAAHFFLEYGRRCNAKTCILMVAHHQASADLLLECFCELAKEKRMESQTVVRITSNNYRLKNRTYQQCYRTVREFYLQYERQLDHLRSVLVVTTFQTSLRLRGLRPGLFTHILLDEGAQAWEPEAIAPLCSASKHTKIVIAGDACQVGPSLLVLGEETRKNGMKYSLLERLKMEYDQLGEIASPYSLSLNVNHRCHSDILPIPIKLFYGDMKSSPVNALAHPRAPNPLIFVCSAISRDTNDNKLEAEILLQEATKFVSEVNWPERKWGYYNLQNVAIISSTRTQLVETRNCAHGRFKEFGRARMLTTYQIQGQEFQALFLSTTEPLSENGDTCNPTKSPCDPYVFNTLLTRARSLVVAVGNPNTLLGIERHMVAKYGSKARCWSNFLNQCLDNNTFFIPTCVEKSPTCQETFKRDLQKRVKYLILPTPPLPTPSKSTRSKRLATSDSPKISGASPSIKVSGNASLTSSIKPLGNPGKASPISTSSNSLKASPTSSIKTLKNPGKASPSSSIKTSSSPRPLTRSAANSSKLTPNSSREAFKATSSTTSAKTLDRALGTTTSSITHSTSARPASAISVRSGYVLEIGGASSSVSKKPNSSRSTNSPSKVQVAKQNESIASRATITHSASSAYAPGRPTSCWSNHSDTQLEPTRTVSSGTKLQPTKTASMGSPSQKKTPPINDGQRPAKPPNIPPKSVLKNVSALKEKRGASGQQSQSSLMVNDQTEFPGLHTAGTKLSKKANRRITAQNLRDQPAKKRQHALPADKKYTLSSHSNFYKQYEDKLCLEAIECELTRENYKKKFHHLLCWEEMEHCRMLERYNGRYKIVLFSCDKDQHLERDDESECLVQFGYIACKEGDSDDAEKLSYAKQASEGSYIKLDRMTIIHVEHERPKYVREKYNTIEPSAIPIAFTNEQNDLLLQWNRKCHGNYKFPGYINVQFELKHSYFERLHKAIGGLSQDVLNRIIPHEGDIAYSNSRSSDDIKVYSPFYKRLELDKTCQFQALRMILSSDSHCPLLIAGPFGTGKTRLLARAAFELLRDRNNKVLICAHHQASVDTFVEYFGAIKEDSTRPWYTNFVRVATKHHRSDIKEKYFQKFKTVGQVNSHRPYRLVITTLGLAPYIAKSHGNGYFTHILIDEGAQTREPETVGPLCLAGMNTKIIIAGDHYQVGPRLLVFGKEAQSYGLGTSIMERLYTAYDKFREDSRSLHSELSTNYRCHQGILMLPSHLFYDSTLLCRSKTPAHPDAPFPLVFVCSSLNKAITERKSTDNTEADCLLRLVDKYMSGWPSNWGKKDLETICIMSPSENQWSLINKKIRKNSKRNLDGVEVLKAYDIQGREYRAIFIGTAEVTDENGVPRNKTKSLCDRFVFNTAITRSQSLVVVVGNPYHLIHGEDNLVVNYDPQDTRRCWSHYLQRCFDSKSFHLSDHFERTPELEQDMKSLKDLVYHRCQGKPETLFPEESEMVETRKDAILQAYRSMFQNNSTFKNAHLKLTRVGTNVLSWNIDESTRTETPQNTAANYEDNANYVQIYPCVLSMAKYGKGKAVPLDPKQDVVLIRGFNNRKGAFDGDTVQVGIFDDNPDEKNYGKVLHVIERGNDSTFICRVTNKNSTSFSPISGTEPLFINLPFLTRQLLESKDKASVQERLQSTEDVVVFDPQSVDACLKSGDLPKIKGVIPLTVARNMLFLVKFVKWDLDYRSPLGAVIEALPKGMNLYNAERLLKLQFNINHVEDDQCSIPQAEKTSNDSVDFYGFTVDPDDAMFLDDAVSLKQLPSTESGVQMYELGVHIINVAKHVTTGSEADKLALHRGTSVYPGTATSLKAMHMFPSSVRERLTLSPGRCQNVLSCSATVSIRDQRVSIVSEPHLREAILESLLKLSYGTAQHIMEGNFEILNHSLKSGITKIEQFNKIPLRDAMKTLYTIAFYLRQERLKSDASYVYEVSDPGEEHCWQTHMLIEELMIWINSIVAKRICLHYPNSALLRRQRFPNMQQQAKVVIEHQPVMGYSHKISQLLPQNRGPSVSSKGQAPCLLLPAHRVRELKDLVTSGRKTLLTNFLTSSRNFPQLAVIDTMLQKNQSPAEYCCTIEGTDSEEYRHYNLNLLSYTHFSSPLRRYIDIVVQRMLSGMLCVPSQLPVFPRDQQEKLCQFLNRKSKNAKRFEGQISSVSLASDLTVSSKVYEAFVCNIERGNIELSFPSLELKNLKSKDRSFLLQHLGPLERPREASGSTFEISMQMTSLSEVLGAFILDSPAFQHIQQRSSNVHGAENSQAEQFPIQLDLLIGAEDDTLEVSEYSAQHYPVVAVMPPADWSKCMEFVKDNSDEKLSEIKECFLKLPHYDGSTHVVNVPKPELCPISHCKFQFDLQPYEVLKVWLTWSATEAFISPAIQLIELAPFARVCIQHNASPALCFSDPNLLYASKREYTNLEHYVTLWEKLVLAEAAEKSCKERNLSILHGVKLVWPKLIIPSNCVDEKYFLPDGKVSFTLPKNFTDQCSELFKINIGDLVCARYGTDPASTTRTVFHMVVCDVVSEDVKDVEDTSTSIIVFLKIIGTSNCRISESVKRILKDCCELQVIPLSTSYQRVYSGLVNLLPHIKKEDARTKIKRTIRRSELACKVALGTIAQIARGSVDGNEVVKVLRTDEYASRLWAQRPAPRLQMNAGQEAAIKSSSNVAFRLIQGPPGTGKSETGAHMAYIFARLNRNSVFSTGNCVLYCGPSNKAVDVVLEKLHKLCNLQTSQEIKILRIYGKSLESRDFPDPGKKAGRYFQEGGSDYTPRTWTEGYALHHIIRKRNKLIRDKEIEFSKLPKGKVPSGIALNQYRRAIKKAEQKELQGGDYDIIFCTCNEASSQRVQQYVFPQQVIVDESGMAIEPETIIPVSICEHVILIGDHKQLQPVIDYTPAKQNGLSVSLFERYAETFAGFTETLTTQYRMHEEICRFPSKHFYEGKLQTDNSVTSRTCRETRLVGFWPGPLDANCPILFCDVVGTEGEHNAGNKGRRRIGPGSKFNIDEARKAVEILSVLHHVHKVDQNELAVLTPYSAQEERIKDLAVKAGLADVTITTIIKSQGDEYGFVVLSTVRSQPIDEISNPDHVQPDYVWLRESLGFVTDEHQINVGITRSKYGLVIVGNRMLLEYDLNTWKPLIAHYKERNCIAPGKRFPTQRDVGKLPPRVNQLLRK